MTTKPIAPSTALPCMGGWCKSREKCLRYHSTRLSAWPEERMCGKVEVPLTSASAQAIGGTDRPASWLDAVMV